MSEHPRGSKDEGRSPDDVLLEIAERMEKAVGHTQTDFASVRTGRAMPALVEKLKVEYYGTEQPLQQLAGIKVPEARLLLIQPYDKNSMKAIEKAIQHSDLGINPSSDGQVIRLVFPQLTEERRKELVKVVKHKAEEGRVAVRNLRRAARHELETLEREHEISSDELERAEKELEKLTHTYVAEIDRMVQHKEQELLEV
jgi:ribosome recycling factor